MGKRSELREEGRGGSMQHGTWSREEGKQMKSYKAGGWAGM